MRLFLGENIVAALFPGCDVINVLHIMYVPLALLTVLYVPFNDFFVFVQVSLIGFKLSIVIIGNVDRSLGLGSCVRDCINRTSWQG